MIRRPVIPRRVFVALAKPTFTASSKLFGDPAMISVTLATLGSDIFYHLLFMENMSEVYPKNNRIVNEKKCTRAILRVKNHLKQGIFSKKY
jgi:hypothetical protein